MPDRRSVLAGLAALSLPKVALAHHGWTWTSNEEFRLDGVVRNARLGNPHGVLDVEATDGVWVVEVGQPWRNQRAGLTDDLLVPGVDLAFEGHRSRDPKELRMKAERVIIAGKT